MRRDAHPRSLPPDPLSPWPELRSILRHRGLTLADVARGSGIPYQTLSRPFNGYNRPSALILDRVAGFLSVPRAELAPKGTLAGAIR